MGGGKGDGMGFQVLSWEKKRTGTAVGGAEPGQGATSHPLWTVEAEGLRSTPLSSLEITNQHPSIRPSNSAPRCTRPRELKTCPQTCT